MTDRFKGVCVTFDQDIREDDAEVVIAAIQQIRGVLSVTPSVANIDDHMNRERVRYELRDKLFEVLK